MRCDNEFSPPRREKDEKGIEWNGNTVGGGNGDCVGEQNVKYANR